MGVMRATLASALAGQFGDDAGATAVGERLTLGAPLRNRLGTHFRLRATDCAQCLNTASKRNDIA